MKVSKVVGLDMGTTCVRAVELASGSSGVLTLVRVREEQLPLGAVRDGEVADAGAVTAALKQLWRAGRFSTRNVVIGVGNQRVLVRDLSLPWLPHEQLKKSLPYQVQELLPVSADEALLDFVETGEAVVDGARTVSGLFVAAVKETVTANVLATESAGLSPVVVDLNALALVRALTGGQLGSRVAALVDIGARSTTVVIVEHGVPRFVRVIPSGGLDVTEAVASSMGCSMVDAEKVKRDVGIGFSVSPDMQPASEAISGVARTLVESVRSSLVFYGSQHADRPVEVMVLTGGGALLPGLGQYLSSATRLSAMLGDPLENISLGKAVEKSAFESKVSGYAMAIGLAQGVAA